MKKKWIYKTVIYIMILSMLLSTLIFTIDALI
ncbi:stressosome-associated protein Prli42 [Insulibacter thermoxylanivorax]|nr:stressosome-associated protein Prli42 [Insulibacter thermoxylanivorax]